LNKIRTKKFNEKRDFTPQQKDSVETEELFVPEKKELPITDGEYQERGVIRLLLTYGPDIVLIESEDEDGKPTEIEISVAELIIHELSHDNIILDNILYNTVYNEFVSNISENNKIPDQKHFIYHENDSIGALTVDILTFPYSISNWETKDIYITKEENILKKSIYSTINAIKSVKIEFMREDLRKKINEESSYEKQIEFLTTLRQLEQAKVVINKTLGRIIIK